METKVTLKVVRTGVTMLIVVRRCMIFSPPRRQAASDFEGLKVCEKKRSGKEKACTKEKYR